MRPSQILDARAVLAGLAVALLGCVGEPSTPQKPSKKATPIAATLVFEALPCDPRVGGDHDPVHELRARASRPTITIEADYLIIKRVRAYDTATVAERGEACTGATSKSACQSVLGELERTGAPTAQPCPVSGDGDCPERMYVLTTHGDTPQLWSSPEQIRQLLGPIDTADDAWLLAQAVNHVPHYMCGDRDFSAIRADADGYELRERQYTSRCPVELTEYRHRVNRDGTVRRLGSAVVDNEPGCSSSF